MKKSIVCTTKTILSTFARRNNLRPQTEATNLKNFVLAISFAVLVTGYGFAQNDSPLQGLRRVPKGVTAASFKDHVIAPEYIKNVTFETIPVDRAPKLKISEDVKNHTVLKLDVTRFGETVHTALKDKVTGYAMQVRENGQPIYGILWKAAQTPADSNKGWTENTQMHVASVSKFLTAVGLVKLLDSKGISYDAKIIDYLPTYWTKGPNINQITFRHLLTQTSGFDNGDGASDFHYMKQRVAQGVSGVGTYCYKNMNFGLMRVLISLINGDISKTSTFHIPYATNDQVWDGVTIAFYREYMEDQVFAPAGVTNASLTQSGNHHALAYNFPAGNAKGWNSGDLSTIAGGAAWHLSVKQLLDVMNHVRRKNTIIPAPKAQYMLDHSFGIDQIIDTAGGMIYDKNGGFGISQGTEQCAIYFLPDGREVAIYVNSPIGTNNAFLLSIVNDAFANSLRPYIQK